MGGEGEARTRMVRLCELCDSEAELHCAADSAFLCRSCDENIHSSNFLVARHLRRFLCPNCTSLAGKSFTGGVFSPQSPREIFCSESCSSILLPSSSSSSSSSFSSCYSSLDSISSSELSSTAAGENQTQRRRNLRSNGRVRGEADGVFVNWCENLGLREKARDVVVSSATWALRVLMEKPMVVVLPYRVSLTASFWFGMRVASEARTMMTWQNLRRLQEISGVPGKRIVAVERRISRSLRRWRVDLQEGWAESQSG